MATVGVRTCGVQDTLECLASYQEGDYSGIMLRLEYSNRTITNCGDLLDSNVASMGSAIACLSSAHLNKRGWWPKRHLPHAKMLLVPIRFFPLPGRLCSGTGPTFSLNKCDS